jgi:hypothetical protein
MQSTVYKALRAINRVNPEAYLLGPQPPWEFGPLGQGSWFFLVAELRQLELIRFFELQSRLGGEILLCDDGDGVAVFLLDCCEDVCLQEEVKLDEWMFTSVTGLFSPFQQRLGQEEKE